MTYPKVCERSLAVLGKNVLVEAAGCVVWHAARVRPAKNPAMPLSTANRLLRTARDVGLCDGATSLERAQYVLRVYTEAP